jgi:hypothetical protein
VVTPDGARDFSMPAWMVILPVVGIAAMPWISSRMHFNLRTLLIAMTLVAVALYLVIWAAK